jgi:hypothetical protein
MGRLLVQFQVGVWVTWSFINVCVQTCVLLRHAVLFWKGCALFVERFMELLYCVGFLL